MSDAAFDKQIVETLAFEGGYGNDPVDPGGETNFGISKAAYPDVDIRGLTREEAIAIYKRDYWERPRISELPDSISGKVFDMGVNMGSGTAIRLFQQVLNELNVKPTLVEDGRIGPATIAACSQVTSVNVLARYRSILAEHYMAIIRRNPAMARFQRGWLRRANA